MVNNTRNLAYKVNAFLPPDDKENRVYFSAMIINFTKSVRDHLRMGVNIAELDEVGVNFKDNFKNVKHVPNRISSMLYQRANELYVKKVISGDHLFLMDKEMKELRVL